jgi:hypothetical protein
LFSRQNLRRLWLESSYFFVDNTQKNTKKKTQKKLLFGWDIKTWLKRQRCVRQTETIINNPYQLCKQKIFPLLHSQFSFLFFLLCFAMLNNRKKRISFFSLVVSFVSLDTMMARHDLCPVLYVFDIKDEETMRRNKEQLFFTLFYNWNIQEIYLLPPNFFCIFHQRTNLTLKSVISRFLLERWWNKRVNFAMTIKTEIW